MADIDRPHDKRILISTFNNNYIYHNLKATAWQVEASLHYQNQRGGHFLCLACVYFSTIKVSPTPSSRLSCGNRRPYRRYFLNLYYPPTTVKTRATIYFRQRPCRYSTVFLLLLLPLFFRMSSARGSVFV